MTIDVASDLPLVIIGVPVYNGARMLGDLLLSLEKQTFTRFRVVICDNASTDTTPDIARTFAARDPRFIYCRNPMNIGAAPNFNRVYERDHSAPFYKWAAHDDVYAPTYLERCLALLESDSSAVAAHSITVMVDETREGHAAAQMLLEEAVLDRFTDEQGRPAWTIGPLYLAESDDPVQRLDDCLNRMRGAFQIFGIFRTSVLEQTQLYGSYYGSDRALLAQLVLLGRFRQVPDPLYINRFHKAASRRMPRAQQRYWIDSKGGKRWFVFQMHWDILWVLVRARLSPALRARCAALTLRHFAAKQSLRIAHYLARLTRGDSASMS